MKYTFKYKRIELDRMAVQCVDIPELQTEQLVRDSSAVTVMQDAYDALNMFLSIGLLIGQKISLPVSTCNGDGYFHVDVSKSNESKLAELL